MSESDDLRLLPEKRAKLTDWKKCILCQIDTNESPRKATATGVRTLSEAAELRNDDTYRRISPFLHSLQTMEIIWHASCYKTYTSKRNLGFLKPSSSKVDDQVFDTFPSSIESRSSRSEVHVLDWSLCLFCQRKKHKGCKNLINVSTFDACESIRIAAETRCDSAMILNIRDVDLIAAEAKYHSVCRANYVSKSNLKTYEFKEDGKREERVYAEAFESLVLEIGPGLTNGRAYNMSFLLAHYKSILTSSGITSPDGYRSEKLKRRLQHHFGDSVVFHKQPDPTKPELLYSSNISLQDIINGASMQAESLTVDKSPIRSPATDLQSEEINALYHAAQIVRIGVKDCKGINIKPLCADDVSLNRAKAVIPESLYNFLCWVIAQPDKLGENVTTAPICQNSEDERRVFMVGQDLVHAATHGRVKTPKHVGLAVTTHHITGSKQMVTLLNRMGHCSSYDDVEVVDTSLAREIMAKSEEFGVVVPSNITPGVFTQFAGDNNDINEETLDGKQTTHATTLVAYQPGHFGPRSEPRVQADHSVRRRSLEYSASSQDILEFSARGKRPSVKAFLGKVNEEWYRSPTSFRSASERKDLAWFLLRLNPSDLFTKDPCSGQQTVPGWSAFNAQISAVTPSRTTIGYCPLISGSPTEFSTVYTVLKSVQAMMASLDQTNSVITFDLAIYVKAKEIQWRYPDEFKNMVIRMGGFHIALNYLAVIGKRFQESGLQDLLTESGVYGSNTATALLKGKSYNRGVRAHKLVTEAFLRLQWHAFSSWVAKQRAMNQLHLIDDDAVCSNLKECISSVSNREELRANFDNLCDAISDVQILFDQFKEEASTRSQLFHFWDSYIDMVLVLLQFIRAERDGNWSLHLAATADMTPHFCSMDRTNYSRWLPVYLADMYKLPESAPRVHEEFMQGNHPVSRSNQPFSQVWTDMALEQSVNRDSKTRGGIVGITQKPGTLERWFLTAHEKAAVTSATKDLCGMSDSSEPVCTHKEGGAVRVNRDEDDVKKLMSTIKGIMTNPFDLEESDDGDTTPLMNLATGVVMPSDAATKLLNSESLGKKKLNAFVDRRLNSNEISFWDPLPHLKIKTFAHLLKKTQMKSVDEKIVTVNADRDLFARLLIAAKSRDVDLQEVLSYELSTVPYSLAHTDGTLRKSAKSILLTELEKVTEVEPRLPVEGNSLSTAHIFDGMAVVQMVKSAGAPTFGEMASKYFQMITAPLGKNNCNRVDVVFDRYDTKDSIKSGERQRRGSSTGFEIKISGPNTPVPKQWHKYISNPKNKSNLQVFLSQTWCELAQSKLNPGQQLVVGGGFESPGDARLIIRDHVCPLRSLESDHEEADTRMVLHAKNASLDHKRVVVQSPDTDVAVLCVYAYTSLQCEQLWFRTGVKDKLRYIPVHKVAQKLGPDLCKVLPGFHALTGCDTTSGLSHIGKKKAWKALMNSPGTHPDMLHLGDETPPSLEAFRACEKFLCSIYTPSRRAGSSADEVRYWMFCQRKQKNETLPPTSDSLHHHIERANFQTLVWKRCLVANQGLPSPIGNGWMRANDVILPVLMTKDPAPKSLVELTVCKCDKSACKRDEYCSCKAMEMSCTEACSCMSLESCQNPHKVECISDTSDDEA